MKDEKDQIAELYKQVEKLVKKNLSKESRASYPVQYTVESITREILNLKLTFVDLSK